MFYQINAQAEDGIGEAPVTRRERRGYTVLFAITRLDLWLNPRNQKLAYSEYPILIHLKSKHLAILTDTTDYYVPPSTGATAYKWFDMKFISSSRKGQEVLKKGEGKERRIISRKKRRT